jgi:putative ABC transport system permease protein
MDDDVAFAIRTPGEPGGLVQPIRRAIAEIDPELPLFDVRGLEERISRSLSDRRTPMVLTLGFGLLALLLASSSSSGRARSAFGWPLAATGRRSSGSCCAKVP